MWHFIYRGNGYYSILSVNSDFALAVKPGHMNSPNTPFVQEVYSSAPLSQQWQIHKSPSGNFIIRPRSGEMYSIDWCMAWGNSAIGVDSVYQTAYSNDTSYYDEWQLNFKGYALPNVRMEGQETNSWCWATAARIFAKQNTQSFDSTKNQEAAVDIVRRIFHPTDTRPIEDVGGSIFDAKRAINFYINDLHNLTDLQIKDKLESTNFATVHNEKICDDVALTNLLDAGELIYIVRGKFVENGDGYERDGGHANIMYGYVYIDGLQYFLIRDPMPVACGSTQFYTFQQLYTEEISNSEDDTYYMVWEGFIVRTQNTTQYILENPNSKYIQ